VSRHEVYYSPGYVPCACGAGVGYFRSWNDGESKHYACERCHLIAWVRRWCSKPIDDALAARILEGYWGGMDIAVGRIAGSRVYRPIIGGAAYLTADRFSAAPVSPDGLREWDYTGQD